jgi:glycosyltransferase involved in cell wall biosynthesis
MLSSELGETRGEGPGPWLSVVVPIFEEVENVGPLHAELAQVLGTLDEEAEILFVDDGSRDGSTARLEELARKDQRVRVVCLSRNYGQTAALQAGFDHARGDVIVTLDGDLQNDPADIPRLVSEIEAGFDIVAGWRKNRQDGFVLRRLPSVVANWLIGFVTGVTIHDTGCTLKAFRRELVKNLPLYAEQHRFLPAMSAGSGARVSEMVVNHRPRIFGHSKYGIGRATRVLLDLLTIKLIGQFSQRPLHYFGLLAAFFFGLTLFFASVALIGGGSLDPHSLSVHTFIGRWQSMIASICMLLATLIFYFGFLGLLSELVVKASGIHGRRVGERILTERHG